MPLPDDYLRYPARRYGMDHDRYDWSILFRRPPVAWPGGARVALWVTTSLQWYPLDMAGKPVAPPGRLNRYPDYRNYTHRDYGLRIGIFRILKALDRLGIEASVPMNSAVAERHPSLVDEIVGRGWEVVGHGVDMGRMQHGALSEEDERALIRQSLATLRAKTGQPVRGWLSIGKLESTRTPDLLAAEGVDYLCDWVNDDLPYRLRTRSGVLWSMPHTSEVDDRVLLLDLKHRDDEFVEQVKDQIDALLRESERCGGRVMSISLHPWVSGQPHRIRMLEQALGYCAERPGVWIATGAQILDAFRAAQS